MHRTNLWLTLAAVVLAAAYAALLRTGTGLEPRTPVAEAVARTAETATPTEPLEPLAPVVVSVPPRADRPSKSYEQPQFSAPIPEDSVVLIREIQRELQRVGCYARGINGIWTTSSRMAAQMFIERMNARLPIDAPDAALLSLLQSQQQPVCGSSCPSGQSNDGANRCVPVALGGGASLGSKLSAAPDKPAPPGAAPEPQAFHERRAADADAPAGHAQPASKKSAAYWRDLMRSVDHALGFY
jgi:hypothetical protein